MLRLIDVCKSFKFGKNRFLVLDKINLDFKKNELVFILGKSGSGKSTLLNIIGGILEVDSGKVMLDDRDITKFNNNMLCSYRNNMIGHIFQDYHLVEYMSVLDNVKLGQTIVDGTGDDIEDILRKLGIYSKRKIKVNKLSGGEKQRVAIARAIINNPDIILCDEPTGALDSSNSIKIMEILKKISHNKLVIVVSHDNVLANKYADRIINIVDGKVDYYPQIDDRNFKMIVNKKISNVSIFKLAMKNLGLKKWRTIFTSVAISIGLVCMLLVLCLSRSFNDDIDKLEREIVSVFPISVYNGDFEIVDSNIVSSDSKIIKKNKDDYIHTNKITDSYIDYVNDIDGVEFISYEYDISMPVVSDKYKMLDSSYMKRYPSGNVNDNYEILYGKVPDSIYEIVLKVDSNNNVCEEILKVFDIDSDIEYDKLIGRKLRIILNDLYYVKNGDYYFVNSDNEKLYLNSKIELKVVGIVREKEVVDDNSYFYCNERLANYIIDMNSNSEIVKDQLNKDYNILGIDMDRDVLLSYLGYETLPSGMNIYVSSLDNKEKVINKLDKYNDSHEKLVYVDTIRDTIDILKEVINIITVILVVFSLISVLVSSLMIFILTNNRVMERIKEIGILRSIGARSRDISKLFNTENFIVGIISSIIGIIIMGLLCKPINIVITMFLGDSMFNIYKDLVIITIIFNIFIVVLSGYIPSIVASKKRIVDCIYNRF